MLSSLTNAYCRKTSPSFERLPLFIGVRPSEDLSPSPTIGGVSLATTTEARPADVGLVLALASELFDRFLRTAAGPCIDLHESLERAAVF